MMQVRAPQPPSTGSQKADSRSSSIDSGRIQRAQWAQSTGCEVAPRKARSLPASSLLVLVLVLSATTGRAAAGEEGYRRKRVDSGMGQPQQRGGWPDARARANSSRRQRTWYVCVHGIVTGASRERSAESASAPAPEL